MRRAIIATTMTLFACVKPQTVQVDLDLPEKTVAVDAQAPLQILHLAAADASPGLRAQGLRSLILYSKTPEQAAHRALWDPDGWVQRQAIRALARRKPSSCWPESAERLLARTDDLADPFAQSEAVFALLDESGVNLQDAMRIHLDRPLAPWQGAPLWFAANAAGLDGGVDRLHTAISDGDLAFDPEFLRALGQADPSSTLPALQAGQPWAEEQLADAYLAARLALGDATAVAELEQGITGDDAMRAIEILDYLAHVDTPEATTLLNAAKRSNEPLVTDYAEILLAARGAADPAVFKTTFSDPNSDIYRLSLEHLPALLASHPNDKSAAKVARSALQTTLKTPLADDLVLLALSVAESNPDLVSATDIEVFLTHELLGIRAQAAAALLAGDS